MNKSNKLIDELKTEVSSLKIRLRRIEQFLLSFPNRKGYAEDELFNKAKELVTKYDSVSASLLQRRLKIGYARAARLLDQLEESGMVSEGEGGKPRKVLGGSK